MVRVEESAEHTKIVEGTFQVLETFKGAPPPDRKVLTMVYAPGGCGMPFLAGSDYLFFLAEGRKNFVQIGEGSFGPFNAENDHVKKELAELRALTKPR